MRFLRWASTDREAEGGGREAGRVHEVGAGVGLPGVADGHGPRIRLESVLKKLKTK